MAKLYMCRNSQCRLSRGCYRFRAKPETLQMYQNYQPEEQGDKLICEGFVEFVPHDGTPQEQVASFKKAAGW